MTDDTLAIHSGEAHDANCPRGNACRCDPPAVFVTPRDQARATHRVIPLDDEEE